MRNPDLEKINKFLLKKWDPIGVSDNKGAEDEYSQYANDILVIIQRSNSYRKLFEYLWELETCHMGLRGNKEKTETFSRMLFDEMRVKKKPLDSK